MGVHPPLHPDRRALIVAAPALQPIATLVRSSHENLDGTGYPDGLAGDEIPLGSRIIAVRDAFDPMATDRPYRRATGQQGHDRRAPALCGTPVRPRSRRTLPQHARWPAGSRAVRRVTGLARSARGTGQPRDRDGYASTNARRQPRPARDHPSAGSALPPDFAPWPHPRLECCGRPNWASAGVLRAGPMKNSRTARHLRLRAGVALPLDIATPDRHWDLGATEHVKISSRIPAFPHRRSLASHPSAAQTRGRRDSRRRRRRASRGAFRAG